MFGACAPEVSFAPEAFDPKIREGITSVIGRISARARDGVVQSIIRAVRDHMDKAGK
jgi:hypothetical protein